MPDPLYSAGARYERAAMRQRLARKIKKWIDSGSEGREAATLQTELKWIMDRQKRYDKKPGGL